jgi:exodeoxyribonuclease VII large subunit
MERLQTRMCHMISLHAERLRGVVLQLHSLSPLLTIARGYAIVRREDNQQIVTQVADTWPGDYLTIQVRDGSIPVEVRK